MSTWTNNLYLGVEWVGDQIRAGVFDARWRLKGKASRSAKTQRGVGEVLKRMARCALDAVDEADRQPEDIAATGILTDGHGAGQSWGPQQVNQLASHLPPRMAGNLLTAGRTATVLWAVHAHELCGVPRSWLGLFSEPDPALLAAERAQPGGVKPLTISWHGTREETGVAPPSTDPAPELLTAVHQAQPEVLVLVGPAYEDAEAPGTRQIRELLQAADLKLPIHIPALGMQVGVWAAARLAAQTFFP